MLFKHYIFSVSISPSCLLLLPIVDCVFSLRKLLQRATSQRRVNANELCTKALPGS